MSDNLRSLQYTRAPLKEIEQALEKPDIKVGELALLALGSILQHPDFPQEYLEKFRGKEYSKKVFGLSYPLLIRRRDWQEKAGQYYTDNLLCGDEYYWLTSAWAEAHRIRLMAWIERHKIDRDERRGDWKLDELPAIAATKSSRALSKAFFAGRTSPKETWVMNLGKVKQKSKHVLRDVRLPKRLLEMLAKQGRLCVFQLRVAGVIKLYTIEATDLDKAFWRDYECYHSKVNVDNWYFELHPVSGKLYNSVGSRFCFAVCRVGSARNPLPEDVYEPKTLPAWVNDVPKPVSPVLPSLRASRARQKIRLKKEVTSVPVKNKPKKEPQRRPPLHVVLPMDNEPRVRVEILTSELNNTRNRNKRMCLFRQKGVSKRWEIHSDDLLTCLQSKRVAPIVYKERGEVWQFYLDAKKGQVYKHSSGGSEILRLREVDASSQEREGSQ